MDDGKTPASPVISSKAEPRPATTDAELSRMAREAVHQAPDPHLDRHLQRMGLVDSLDAADRDLAQPVPAPVESGVTIQLLERRLRRAEISVAVLGIIVVVLALIEVIQLLR